MIASGKPRPMEIMRITRNDRELVAGSPYPTIPLLQRKQKKTYKPDLEQNMDYNKNKRKWLRK